MDGKTYPIETLAKAPTGIADWDDVTGGGWPRGTVTLIVSGTGSGRTILELQPPVNGGLFDRPVRVNVGTPGAARPPLQTLGLSVSTR